jgi:hypothetical protein
VNLKRRSLEISAEYCNWPVKTIFVGPVTPQQVKWAYETTFSISYFLLKTQSHEIFDLWFFFHKSNTPRPLINTLNYFRIRFKIRGASVANFDSVLCNMVRIQFFSLDSQNCFTSFYFIMHDSLPMDLFCFIGALNQIKSNQITLFIYPIDLHIYLYIDNFAYIEHHQINIDKETS